MTARSAVRWAATHGVVRLGIRARARAGWASVPAPAPATPTHRCCATPPSGRTPSPATSGCARPGRWSAGRSRGSARDHVAFSSGIHFCLGAALARMEGEVALQALFERFPDLAPAGPARRRGTIVLRGHDSLPVTPGRAVRHVPA